MRDIEYVEATNPSDFAIEFRKVCTKIDKIGKVIDHYFIGPSAAHIVYEFDSEPETKEKRYCCECSHFEWVRKCPKKTGIVNHMDFACECFTTEEVAS